MYFHCTPAAVKVHVCGKQMQSKASCPECRAVDLLIVFDLC